MYEEGHRGFVFRNIILKMLLVIIIVFFIIWLFPTKNYVKNLINNKLGNGSNQVFNNNISVLKEAGMSYFNGERLPDKEGVSKTLTLKEMLDKGLLVDLIDGNGKKCNAEKSYVTVTKNKKDYLLKANLVCSDRKASINSYIGSNDSCSDAVCSKKKINDSKDSNDDDSSTKEVVNNEQNSAECEYVKNVGGYFTNYGAWSNWDLTPVAGSNLRQVETKIDKVEAGTIVEENGIKQHTQEPKKVIVTTNGVRHLVYVCPSDFDNGGTYNSYVTCIKTMPDYVTKTTYRNATFYRYRDRSYINNSKDTKWSNCNNQELLNAGYAATGNTR